MDENDIWESIDLAPQDGSKMIARGHDWGNTSCPYHYAEVYWCLDRAEWRNMSDPTETMTYLTQYIKDSVRQF